MATKTRTDKKRISKAQRKTRNMILSIGLIVTTLLLILMAHGQEETKTAENIITPTCCNIIEKIEQKEVIIQKIERGNETWKEQMSDT